MDFLPKILTYSKFFDFYNLKHICKWIRIYNKNVKEKKKKLHQILQVSKRYPMDPLRFHSNLQLMI